MSTSIETTISVLYSQVDRETVKEDNDFININPYFQREYTAWDSEMKTKFIISILCGYRTNPLWLIKNEDNDCQDLLDGKHRLMTAITFMKSKDPLKPDDTQELYGWALNAKYIDNVNLKSKYGGKTFHDLSSSEKSNFRNFKFTINLLSKEEGSPDRIVYWWNILNKSSKPLNHYELMKILFDNLYTLIHKRTSSNQQSHSEKFGKTILYDKKDKDGEIKSKRGELQYSLLQLISLAEPILPTSYTSYNDLYDKWLFSQFGNKKEEIDKKVIEKTEELNKRCITLFHFIDIFTKNGLFIKENLQANKVIAARCTALIGHDHANHYSGFLSPKFKTDIYDGIKKDCLGVQQRNGKFQKVLIEEVDKVILEIRGPHLEPRHFTDKQKSDKLKEQGGKCATCKLSIQGSGDGDHIKQFGAGGKTVPENLQVLCSRCHYLKESTLHAENTIVTTSK